jgi:signal transduction histidine kinase
VLGNAIKFTKPRQTPKIKVYAERSSSDWARVIVEDDGIGMPEGAEERIFGLFERLSGAYEGTGIGLAIVRKAVERMGGRVGVESELGKGSRFWVELRLAP